jgi:5,10-methenyltetrahydromethanopterin hydrogenase
MLLAVFVLVAAGCATPSAAPGLQQSITAAETTIRQAEQAGGAEHGALALDRAREKLAEARRLVEDEPIAADRLASEAAVDAELAASMAREGQAEEAMAQIREDIRALRAEAAR